MRMKLIAGFASLAFVLPLAAGPAFSAGGGGSDETPTCKKGEVWDKNQGKCVQAGKAQLDDDAIYENGRALAKVERYGEAIAVLSLAADKSDPRILNYLGYSHRKQGRVLVGLGYYEEALRANPDYTLVREYMGEAHLQLGNVAAAREQLVEIEKRCGKGCAEYTELSAQIESFENRG